MKERETERERERERERARERESERERETQIFLPRSFKKRNVLKNIFKEIPPKVVKGIERTSFCQQRAPLACFTGFPPPLWAIYLEW
jgi:hypothetical protein